MKEYGWMKRLAAMLCMLLAMTAVGAPAEENISGRDIPQLHILSPLTGIGKETRVTVPIEYVSDGLSFRCYASMSIQGHSTLSLDKKNYMLRLYDDEELTQKHRLVF